MESLTVATCSLDGGSRQAGFLCMLPSVNTSSSTLLQNVNHAQDSFGCSRSNEVRQCSSQFFVGSSEQTTFNAIDFQQLNHNVKDVSMTSREACASKKLNGSVSVKRLRSKTGKKMGRRANKKQMEQKLQKPNTAYNIFCKERRSAVRLENPDLAFGDVMKILGREWLTLPKNAKQKYVDAAAAEMDRYKRELRAFKLSSFAAIKHCATNATSSEKYNFAQDRINDNSTDASDAIMSEFFEKTERKHSEPVVADLQTISDDSSDLYCDCCNLYFINHFNKTEHLRGQKHIRKLRDKAVKLTSRREASKSKMRIVFLKLPETRNFGDDLLVNFFAKNQERQLELEELRERESSITKQISHHSQEINRLKENIGKVQTENEAEHVDFMVLRDLWSNLITVFDMLKDDDDDDFTNNDDNCLSSVRRIVSCGNIIRVYI